jgi:hypothetical protein
MGAITAFIHILTLKFGRSKAMRALLIPVTSGKMYLAPFYSQKILTVSFPSTSIVRSFRFVICKKI